MSARALVGASGPDSAEQSGLGLAPAWEGARAAARVLVWGGATAELSGPVLAAAWGQALASMSAQASVGALERASASTWALVLAEEWERATGEASEPAMAAKLVPALEQHFALELVSVAVSGLVSAPMLAATLARALGFATELRLA